MTGHSRGARGGSEDRGQAAQRRGFPRAVGPEQPVNLPRMAGQIYAVGRAHFAAVGIFVDFGEVTDGYHRIESLNDRNTESLRDTASLFQWFNDSIIQ